MTDSIETVDNPTNEKPSKAKAKKPAVANLYTDLIEVQKAIPTIAKTSKAVYGNYANFDDIIKIVRPLLNEHNFVLIQKTQTQQGDQFISIGIVTELIHVSGEKVTSDPFIVPLQSEKGKSLAQTAGSILTYAKRYSLCALLGIATGDDTDGNYGMNQQQQSNNYQNAQLTPQLEQNARNCAAQGFQVYESFFNQLSKPEKAALIYSGLHNELKSKFI